MPSDGDAVEVEQDAVYTEFDVDPDEFGEFVEAVSSVVAEARLSAEDDTLHIRAVDPANVAMVEATCDANSIGESFEIGVHIDELHDALDEVSKGQHIKIDEEDEELKLWGITGSAEIPVFPAESIRDAEELPDLEWDADATVEAFRLKGAVGSIAEAVEYRDGSHGVVLETRDGYIDVFGTKNGIEDPLMGYNWEMPADVSGDGISYLTGSYLSKALAGVPPDGDVSLRIGEEAPLVIEYEDWLNYYIAPRLRA